MPLRVLITPLGLAPGAVTTVLDGLRDKLKIKVDGVYIVTTSYGDIVSKVVPFLKEELYRCYGITDIIDKYISGTDIRSLNDFIEYMRICAGILKEQRAAGNEVYISTAGGRGPMGAALTVLGYIFSDIVKLIVHAVVPEEIEKQGSIKVLETLSEEKRREILHPSNYELVTLPVLPLKWTLDDILTTLEIKSTTNIEDIKRRLPHISNVVEDCIRHGLLKKLDDRYERTTVGEALYRALKAP
ncbi:MAG: hypothetical protein DRJ40_09545 [Thermoprotei archaeon]|nr:MAG: hypothetical protein DRJ40_09545 [Thermoprotei archaeon]